MDYICNTLTMERSLYIEESHLLLGQQYITCTYCKQFQILGHAKIQNLYNLSNQMLNLIRYYRNLNDLFQSLKLSSKTCFISASLVAKLCPVALFTLYIYIPRSFISTATSQVFIIKLGGLRNSCTKGLLAWHSIQMQETATLQLKSNILSQPNSRLKLSKCYKKRNSAFLYCLAAIHKTRHWKKSSKVKIFTLFTNVLK